jgi:hypothetical protein
MYRDLYMGFLIEDSRTTCGVYEGEYTFPDQTGSEIHQYRAIYTAYVRAFMRQDGSSSKLSGLHLADTRNCRSWVKGFIDRQIYRVVDGKLEKFGPLTTEEMIEFFVTNKNDDDTNIIGVAIKTLKEIYTFGGQHNTCTPDAKNVFQKLKADMIKSVTSTLKKLAETEDGLASFDDKILQNIRKEEKKRAQLKAERAVWEAGGSKKGHVWHWAH